MNRILTLAILLMASTVQASLLDDSGVRGGLVVVVGCEDTKLAAGYSRSWTKAREHRSSIRPTGNW